MMVIGKLKYFYEQLVRRDKLVPDKDFYEQSADLSEATSDQIQEILDNI